MMQYKVTIRRQGDTGMDKCSMGQKETVIGKGGIHYGDVEATAFQGGREQPVRQPRLRDSCKGWTVGTAQDWESATL